MKQMIRIDQKIEEPLREAVGPALEKLVRDGILAEAYRQGALSIGQIARILGLSIDGAYGFMKERGIPVNYTAADLDADLATLRELRDHSS